MQPETFGSMNCYTYYINYINYVYYLFKMRMIDSVKTKSHVSMVFCIVILAQRSALYLCGWLTLVRDLREVVTIESQNTGIYFWLSVLLYALYVLYILCYRWMLSLKPWNCKSRPNARAILPCSIVWCWVTPSTGVCSGFTAIRFRRKCSTAVIEWTPS